MTLNWRGEWSPDFLYSLGDIVYYRNDGYNYICTSYANGLPPIYTDSGFERFSLVDIRIVDGGLF